MSEKKSYGEIYNKLTRASPNFDKNKILFDKTPEYMQELKNVVHRNPN